MKICRMSYCDNAILRQPHGGRLHTCQECNDRWEKMTLPSPFKGIGVRVSKFVSHSRERAAKNNLEFNINEQDIYDIWPESFKCPILDIDFKIDPERRDTSPSIDRIDSSKGYVRGNIQIISGLANKMKSSATPSQLKLFAKWIQEQEYV